MCQAKSKGGKRCAAHMAGSTATVSMTTVLTGAVESFVKKVFTGLRKEGKNLQAPSREEVIALADNNAMMSRYDVTIPDNRRASLARRWEEAKNETPDGPTFHAWRHTLAETSRSWRKSFAAVGIAGSLMMTSACGVGGNQPDSTPVPSPSVTISQEASPSAVPTVPTPPASSIPVKEVVNNGKGEYQHTTISPDDPALKYDPNVVMPDASAQFTPEEITAAQKTAITFLAEEGIDSTLNDGNDIDGWWAKNKDRIAPELQQPVYDYLKSGKTFVARGSWDDANSKGYTYAYNKDQPRVKSRKIEVIGVRSEPGAAGTSLIFNTDVDYVMAGKDSAGTPKDINVKGSMMYAVRKDAATGNWLITGQKSNYTGYVNNG